jgi:uncharacterized membrane protein YtjA (UPF0391 family)
VEKIPQLFLILPGKKSTSKFKLWYGSFSIIGKFVNPKILIMLRWTVIFLVIAIIAAIFGFGGIAAGAAGIAKILFFIFLVLFVLSLIAGGFRRVD